MTEIQAWAFDRCRSLKEIHLPETLKTIGSQAFKECFSLRTLVIPANVVSIEEDAFDQESGISFFVYPDSYGLSYAQAHSIPYEMGKRDV